MGLYRDVTRVQRKQQTSWTLYFSRSFDLMERLFFLVLALDEYNIFARRPVWDFVSAPATRATPKTVLVVPARLSWRRGRRELGFRDRLKT